MSGFSIDAVMTTDLDVRLLIIADDLTGAVDSAAATGLPGLRLCVPWRAGETDWDLADRHQPRVLAISTDTRTLEPSVAVERVVRAVRWSKGRGYRLVKKVDSLLRGNVAAEIAAFLDEVDASSAVFAPALPAQGRITIAGTQLVDGVPVSSSPAGADPHSPARQSYISALVPAGLRCYPLRINAVREYDLHRLVRGAAGGVIVADAADQSDLDRLREAALSVADVVLIGSSGLIASATPPTAQLATGRVVIVSASRRPEVAVQCARVIEAVPGVAETVVAPEEVLEGQLNPRDWWQSVRHAQVAILRVDPEAAMAPTAHARRANSAGLLEGLATMAAEAFTDDSDEEPLTVVILGGDLAAQVCATLDVVALDVQGVSCGGGGACQVLGLSTSQGRHLVLRSGAFGGRDVLVDAITERPSGVVETSG